ncbi:group 1 glycosyl transferase [Tolypothrix tenuis PCC 7101]|uniref:Group 1 glycosyl transferase n=1 Tax=Tolypothrix tenuis PCC 7101 TaxID=231146 RepID=A0A1Z4N8V6_9CYAN|nr:glycosyltransferase family 4 protein [Aulosira sp. FACHB-113]BAZ02154.1 group 1 glycosyl transferase [Tolypothrix tenuis PCC 7101]BAZ73925.1 group 1 glycosyl transferase [Aulosira laxa NIES-50]
MKVVFITHFPNLYGANRSLLNLIDGLKKYGVVPYVISPFEGQFTETLKLRNIEFAIVPIQWWADKFESAGNFVHKSYRIAAFYPKAFKRLYLNLQLIPSLADIVKEWNVDLVYTNSSTTPAGALLAEKLQIPHIWHLREFLDLDYNLHLDWGKLLCNFFIQKSDAQIAISKAIRNHFSSRGSKERMHVVYNGIASTLELERLYKLGNDSLRVDKVFTFALVGLIHANKGQDIAIKALSILTQTFSQVRLLIVGDASGDQLAQLKKLAEDLGVSNQVEFWGYLDDPYQAYLASDVVLMCSKNEGMGRVTVEAMSVCRPVIGYDNAGTSEIIQHEYTGLLYRGDHEALAACMKQLIENPDWAKQLGMNAWKRVFEEYSIETYSQKIYEILLSVVTQHNSSKQLIHI